MNDRDMWRLINWWQYNLHRWSVTGTAGGWLRQITSNDDGLFGRSVVMWYEEVDRILQENRSARLEQSEKEYGVDIAGEINLGLSQFMQQIFVMGARVIERDDDAFNMCRWCRQGILYMDMLLPLVATGKKIRVKMAVCVGCGAIGGLSWIHGEVKNMEKWLDTIMNGGWKMALYSSMMKVNYCMFL